MVQNWDTLKTSIVTAAECSLGHSRRRQPDWFQESADTLAPLIKAKNKARKKMLRTAEQTAGKVKKAVDTVKETWVCNVAWDAEGAVKDRSALGSYKWLMQATNQSDQEF